MNKCEDKFCPDCGHHLYTVTGWTEQGQITYKGVFFCQECGVEISVCDVATYHEIEFLRAKYDARAAEVEA